MTYAARILADSISPAGHRLTTFLVTFPRIVLAEVNTHKMLSKSSASSRAVPVATRIAAVRNDPFVPESFGRNQRGMQPGPALEEQEAAAARDRWLSACDDATGHAEWLSELGVHKQYANRLVEPFSWHTAIVSGTDWSNFFHLRVHPAAQGEFSKAAAMILDCYESSRPRDLRSGEWHIPLVEELEDEAVRLTLSSSEWLDWACVSAARCGRVSFERHDKRDFEADLERAASFAKNGHMSPLEHAARPMEGWELDAYRQFEAEVEVDGQRRTMRMGDLFLSNLLEAGGHLVIGRNGEQIRMVGKPKPVCYCGNYNGFIQLRKLYPNEADALAPESLNSSRG